MTAGTTPAPRRVILRVIFWLRTSRVSQYWRTAVDERLMYSFNIHTITKIIFKNSTLFTNLFLQTWTEGQNQSVFISWSYASESIQKGKNSVYIQHWRPQLGNGQRKAPVNIWYYYLLPLLINTGSSANLRLRHTAFHWSIKSLDIKVIAKEMPFVKYQLHKIDNKVGGLWILTEFNIKINVHTQGHKKT